MNHLTAAESLIAVTASAAHGADVDDGVVIADDDLLRIGTVARWLIGCAVVTHELSTWRVVDALPTVNIDLLQRVAAEQALAMHAGAVGAACAAMGIDQATLWRWRQRWAAEDAAKRSGIKQGSAA